MKLKYLTVLFGVIFVSIALFSVPASLEAHNRKGDKLFKDGRVAESRGNWDAALELYEQAVQQDPNEVEYLLAMRRARFEAGQKHVDAGQKLKAAGKPQEALQEFQKALIADPSSSIALQEIKRMQEASRSSAKPDERGLTASEIARKDSDERVESMLAPPELKPMTAVIPTLKMNNQPPRVLYETVGKLAGINVVFDSQYAVPARNFNVDLSNASADQAFDYLALLTHTFWKPIASNAIFVTEDNVTKRRDYEDDVVKVFYVTNATSVQEFQEIATAIRTVAEIRRVFTYNAQKAMIVRDTVDKVALAEKLVHDLDKPKGEVVVDVIVMQASTERIKDLAATIATAGTAGLNLEADFAPNGAAVAGGTTTPSTTTPLSRLAHLSTNQFTTSLPSAILKAMLSDTRTKVLNNPQVRASDGQKVTLKIGNRIPYATGSFQTNTAAALVSTQFNYADVGVNIDMTPQVHSGGEVTLHIEVTVSSVVNNVNIGGISQPVIGQNANTADIRLREGEMNILGGLTQTSDASTVNGIPGLVNIPVLGKILFGSDHTDKARADLLIVLVPHIVRTPDYTAENLRGIYAGTDQIVKLNYAAKAVPEPAPGTAAAPILIPAPGMSISAPAGTPAAVPPTAASPTAPMPTMAPPVPGAPPVPVSLFPGLGQVIRVGFAPPVLQGAPGSVLSVALQIENATNLVSAAPIRVKFDPMQLRLDDVTLGSFFSDSAGTATLVKDIRNDVGEAVITITRPAGAPPLTGAGAAAQLKFTAIGKGRASVKIPELSLKNPQGEAIPANAGELTVNLQ